MTCYKHKALLTPRSIRLLKIIDVNEPIKCNLEVFDEPWPSYSALSYTWGNPRTQDPIDVDNDSYPTPFLILCDDQKMHVSRNAFDAIRRLGKFQQNNQGDEYFWIDAVCVDQANLLERNSQVTMMGDIYAEERVVLIWLGPSDTDTAATMSIIWRFGAVLDDFANNVVDETEDLLSSFTSIVFNDSAFYKKCGIDPISYAQWRSIAQFFNKRWFNRGWVFQELVLAKEAMVLCGDLEFDVDPLLKFCAFVIFTGWNASIGATLPNVAVGSRISVGPDYISSAIIFRNTRKDGPESLDCRERLENVYHARNSVDRLYTFLENIIHLTRSRQVSDPRDKVFSAISLCTRYFKTRKDQGEWMAPDYTKTTQEIYINFSSFLIRNSPTLSLLSQVEDPSRRKLSGLPSWVPDFNIPVYSNSFTFFPYYNATEHWGAENHSAAYFPASNTLKVNGYVCDHIARFTKTLEDIIAEHTIADWLDLLLGLAEDSSKIPCYLEMLWRTLIGIQPESPSNLSSSFGAFIHFEMALALMATPKQASGSIAFWNEQRTYLRFADAAPEVLPSRLTITQTADEFLAKKPGVDVPYPAEIALMSEYRHMIAMVSSSRRLMHTERGFLGLAPISVQVGDAVTYLKGGRVPFILRKMPTGNYQLIGEVYVHGYMNGEIEKLGPPNIEEIYLE